MGQEISFPAGGPSVVVRLEVWRYSETGIGRNQKENRALAKSFRRENLQDWHVDIVDSNRYRTGSDPNDDYTPLEVDFRYKETGRELSVNTVKQSIRQLFHETIKRRVENFFRWKKNKPLNMSIFPVLKGLSNDVTKDLSHSKILVSMGIPTRTCVDIAPPRVDFSPSTELAHIAGSLPGQIAKGVDVYQMVKSFPAQLAKGRPMETAWNATMEMMESMTGMVELQEKFGESWWKIKSIATPEIRDSWGRSLISLNCFHTLANSLQVCVKRMSEKNGITNQLMYETLANLNATAMMLYTYQGEMIKTIELLNEANGKDLSKSTKRTIFILVASLAAGLLVAGTAIMFAPVTIPIGVALGGAATTAGATVALPDLGKRKEVKMKKKNVDELDAVIALLGAAIEDARIAVAAMFCEQVLNISLQQMPEHRRREILERLGVGIKDMNSNIFREDLTQDRLERVLKTFEDFEKIRGTVRDDTGLREYVEVDETLPVREKKNRGPPKVGRRGRGVGRRERGR